MATHASGREGDTVCITPKLRAGKGRGKGEKGAKSSKPKGFPDGAVLSTKDGNGICFNFNNLVWSETNNLRGTDHRNRRWNN